MLKAPSDMPPEPSNHRIAVRLDRLLEQRGMTLAELADKVGVTVVNLSVLKNGRARAIRFSTPGRPLARSSTANPATCSATSRRRSEPST
jgi:putative transcriptional regulator